MKQEIKIGQADYSVLIFIPDPASTTGAGKTGLAAADLTCSYTRVETDNDVVCTDVTSSLNDLAALTTAHTDWGLKEVNATKAPGLYRLDIADAVFATGAWSAVVQVTITTGLAAASPCEFVMVPDLPYNGVNVSMVLAAAADPKPRTDNEGTVAAAPAPSTTSFDVTLGADFASGRHTQAWVCVIYANGERVQRVCTTHTRVSATVGRYAFSGAAGAADAAFPAAPAANDIVIIEGRGPVS